MMVKECRLCKKQFTEKEIEQKRVLKSQRISQAKKEAKERGEPVGAKRKYDEYKNRILELRKKGLSFKKIADEIGCSVTPIQYHCRGLK